MEAFIDERDHNFDGFLHTTQLVNADLLPGITFFNAFNNWKQHCTSPLVQFEEKILLGRRAEQYFSIALKQDERFELLDTGRQLIRDKRTIGEFDFILRDRHSGKVIHLELVYKFYIWEPDFSPVPLEQWIGPNRNDLLHVKLEKLRKKQFPLLYSPEGRKAMIDLGIEIDEVEQQVCYLMNLFLPFGEHRVPDDLLPEKAIQGKYYRKEQLLSNTFENAQFCLPGRPNWFMQEEQLAVEWLDRDAFVHGELRELFELHRSPLFWMKDEQGEFHRGFAVWW